MDCADLPPSLAEIAEVIGREKALLLVGSLPQSGSRPHRKCLYVPKRMPVDHWLVRQLGWDDAVKFQSAFSGMILQPSNARFWARGLRDDRILQLYRDGVPVAEIAEELGLSVYRVREIIAGQSPEAAQQ